MSPDTYASVKAKHPEVRRVKPSTYSEFVTFIGNSKVPIEEKFFNVKVHTNGSIASVYFDFDFIENGTITNRGSEAWHLVNTDDGWKISSMVYSLGL